MRLSLVKVLPRSLSGRMTLILVLGLLAAQFASLLLHLQERATMLAAGHVHAGMPGIPAFIMPMMAQLVSAPIMSTSP